MGDSRAIVDTGVFLCKIEDWNKLQERLKELELLATDAIESVKFYGGQCEEWYQKKYGFEKEVSDLTERLNRLMDTPKVESNSTDEPVWGLGFTRLGRRCITKNGEPYFNEITENVLKVIVDTLNKMEGRDG